MMIVTFTLCYPGIAGQVPINQDTAWDAPASPKEAAPVPPLIQPVTPASLQQQPPARSIQSSPMWGVPSPGDASQMREYPSRERERKMRPNRRCCHSRRNLSNPSYRVLAENVKGTDIWECSIRQKGSKAPGGGASGVSGGASTGGSALMGGISGGGGQQGPHHPHSQGGWQQPPQHTPTSHIGGKCYAL